MTRRPRTSRHALPTLAALGVSGPHAREDLDRLGWYNAESLDLLWGLACAPDPDLALATIRRLYDALDEAAHLGDSDADLAGLPGAGASEMDMQMRESEKLRTRVFALTGGSTALGEHLVANPAIWWQLLADVPTRADMLFALLEAVEATAERGTETTPAGNPEAAGVFRAGISGPEAEVELQRTYRSLIVRIAAADLAGTMARTERVAPQPTLSYTQVTGLLSDLADAALTAALSVAVARVYPGAPVSSRLAVIALGKCGARELNYISDVDVLFVAEPADARATRLASEFIRIGTKCFFEVDAALRPEGKSGALVRTLDSHIAYYERWAETWEFQAQLKARPMTGDMALAKDYVEAMSNFVWSAAERESFVPDVQAMRRRVIGNLPSELQDRELKLGVGGLRDVEFAVQLLQMVHGRSDESLRVLSTVDALNALVAGGYVGRQDGQSLEESYCFMRLMEHRLQLQKLRRTHTMPAKDDESARWWLARASGIGLARSSTAALEKKWRETTRKVHGLHLKLFYRPLLESVAALDVEALRLTPDAARRQLAALGYHYPDRAYEHLNSLAAGTSRKARIQALLLPSLLEWLSHTADPDAGLLNYRRLSEVLEDKQWFLRMLRDEGVVGQRLMHVLGSSAYVTELLLATPEVVKLYGDGATGPKLLSVDDESITRSLVAAAKRHSDPVKAIAVARALRRAELARIASADLLGFVEVVDVTKALSRVWDAVLEAALSAEIRGWQAANPGEETPAKIAVIGMGRLGGMELGYGSDADVLFVCEPREGVDETSAVKWAIRECDSMRRRLARPGRDPMLEVDVDLRPEGRSGPIVRTLESYTNYYQRWGETWETVALLRATWIAGDADLGKRFLHMVDKLRYPKGGIPEKQVQEVRRMKARIDNERLPRGARRQFHTKLGRGGLTDIEWTVQLLVLQYADQYPGLHNTSTLECLDVLVDEGVLDRADGEKLRIAWLMATKARNALVLVRGKRTDELPQPGPALAPVAGAAGWDPQDSVGYMDHYLRLTRHARAVIDRVFWGEDGDDVSSIADDY